jgi:hypothetical protein
MRSVSPIAPANSNEVGPFCGQFVGGEFYIPSAYILLSASSAAASNVGGGPFRLESGNKVWLHITFSNGSVTGASLKEGSDWWAEYPSTIKYSDPAEPSLKTQTDLYAPVAQVKKTQTGSGGPGPCSAKYTIVRYVHSNLMLMQTCNYFFLIGGPYGG